MGRNLICNVIRVDSVKYSSVYTHSGGVKAFVCQECDKRLSQSNDLKEHMSIHSGEKPYVCLKK